MNISQIQQIELKTNLIKARGSRIGSYTAGAIVTGVIIAIIYYVTKISGHSLTVEGIIVCLIAGMLWPTLIVICLLKYRKKFIILENLSGHHVDYDKIVEALKVEPNYSWN